MRTLEMIATTLKTKQAHPTTVLNALIEAENSGGMAAVADLERRLARLIRSVDAEDPVRPLARAWLEAVRAYLETYSEEQVVHVRPKRFHDLVLHAVGSPFTLRHGGGRRVA